MKKKTRNRVGWWLLIILIAGVAILAGYFMGMERGLREGRERVVQGIPPVKTETTETVDETSPEPGRETPENSTEEPEKEKISGQKYSCKEMEEGLLDFFKYLDTRDYIQQPGEPADTRGRFKNFMMKLSSKPPVPAGEGIKTLVMTENIYHFSRLLSKNDIRMIKNVIHHEADSMELNLHLFYRWLTAGEECPDREGIRPPPEVTYAYAGFFLNTIGGRSYLFRRPSAIRLVISYYCLLIVHDADKRGENSYGIDIFPEISQVLRELSFYKGLHYQGEYIDHLTAIQNYYLGRR